MSCFILLLKGSLELFSLKEYVESKMLTSAADKWFTIFIDETTAVGNKSVANVFIMFEDGDEVSEHYLGTVNMNTEMGLTAQHFYTAALDLCAKKGLKLENCFFSEMDGCATNQGKHKGLKNYYIFENGHHISESCGSHKVALIIKNLLLEGQYECLKETDDVAVGLASYFKDSSLRTAILENAQKVLGH